MQRSSDPFFTRAKKDLTLIGKPLSFYDLYIGDQHTHDERSYNKAEIIQRMFDDCLKPKEQKVLLDEQFTRNMETTRLIDAIYAKPGR